jgi:hypothetical protein
LLMQQVHPSSAPGLDARPWPVLLVCCGLGLAEWRRGG